METTMIKETRGRFRCYSCVKWFWLTVPMGTHDVNCVRNTCPAKGKPLASIED